MQVERYKWRKNYIYYTEILLGPVFLTIFSTNFEPKTKKVLPSLILRLNFGSLKMIQL